MALTSRRAERALASIERDGERPQHTLAGMALEDERLLAVDPLTDSAPDLNRRELVQGNPKPLGFTRRLQDELVGAEFEPTARGRSVARAPDDGVIVRTLANALGGHAFLSMVFPKH